MIKLAQVIGTRSDVLPPEYIKVLSQCHDAVPPRSWIEIAPVLESELGRTADEVFDDFERKPIASASAVAGPPSDSSSLGSLGCRLNVGDAMSVKDRGSVQDYEECNQVGKCHSRIGVASHLLELQEYCLRSD